jgi:hypothetical protein
MCLGSGDLRRSDGQVRSIGFADWTASPAQSPLAFEVTFGRLPGPCETISVERVQVLPLLLTVTTVVLLCPAGMLP